jgi:trehalose synthase
MSKLDNYVPIVGQSAIDDIKHIADKLKGKIIQNINSTSVGGGVAEILSHMIPLLNDVGVDARWI